MSAVENNTMAPVTAEKPHRSLFGHKTEQHAQHPVQQGTYADGTPATGATGAPGQHATTQGHPGFNHAEEGYPSQSRKGFATGFSVVRWLRLHAVDLITMAAMGAVGLGVYEADPAPSRSFPVLYVGLCPIILPEI